MLQKPDCKIDVRFHRRAVCSAWKTKAMGSRMLGHTLSWSAGALIGERIGCGMSSGGDDAGGQCEYEGREAHGWRFVYLERRLGCVMVYVEVFDLREMLMAKERARRVSRRL